MKKLLFIVEVIILLVFFASCSSTPVEKNVESKVSSLRKAKLINRSGIVSFANIDTIFKKGDIIKVDGIIYAVN